MWKFHKEIIMQDEITDRLKDIEYKKPDYMSVDETIEDFRRITNGK